VIVARTDAAASVRVGARVSTDANALLSDDSRDHWPPTSPQPNWRKFGFVAKPIRAKSGEAGTAGTIMANRLHKKLSAVKWQIDILHYIKDEPLESQFDGANGQGPDRRRILRNVRGARIIFD
jgi:hypothetical protein